MRLKSGRKQCFRIAKDNKKKKKTSAYILVQK